MNRRAAAAQGKKQVVAMPDVQTLPGISEAT